MNIFRSRRAPIVAALTAILLLSVAAVFWFRRDTATGPADLSRYFPEREATVLYIDVAAVRASGLLDKLVGSTVGEDPEYKSFTQSTGFDYKRDLDQVMLNSAGGIHYFLLKGRFDWDKLRSYAASQRGTCRDGYCFMKGSTEDRFVSWRPLRRNLMALASARDESGARAVEQRTEIPAGYTIPQSPLWIHLPGEVIRTANQLPPGTKMFAKALGSAERALFTLGPDRDGFQLGMDVFCRTPEDAAILKAQMEELTKLLTSLIVREKKNPNSNDLSGVLTGGIFTRADTHVRGTWPLRRAFLNSLSGS